jgi:hypothetical protein
VVALFGVTAACSSASGSPNHGTAGSVPVVTPSSAYGAFPYRDAAQRKAFQTFLACAADLGVHFIGPLLDSTGTGVFFRLAPGQKASPDARERVADGCPQGTIGLFGTPVGGVHARRFERVATEFAGCIRSHGYPSYPTPTFGSGDPRIQLWQLPFHWSSERFTDAVRACVEPVRGYLFST